MQHLTRLLEDDPEDVDLLLQLAYAYHANRDADSALQVLHKIHPLDPANESARILHAEILSLQEDWAAVIRLLSPVAVHTQSYDVCHLIAEAHRRRGQWADASWYYESATKLKPDAVEDLLQLGQLHLRRQLPALAIRALEQLLDLEYENAEVHYQLAQAYHQAGRSLGKVTVAALNEAVPGSIHKQWYVLGPIEGEPRRYRVSPDNSAIYHLQRAFEMMLDDSRAHLLEADIWYDAGMYERAREIYETIEALVPAEELAGYHYRFGMTLLALGDPQGLIRHLNEALALDPKTYKPKALEAYVRVADYYCLLGDLQQYIDHLQLAVAEAPRSANLRYKLANALMEARKTAESRAQFVITLQLDPQHPDRERIQRIINLEDLSHQMQPAPGK